MKWLLCFAAFFLFSLSSLTESIYLFYFFCFFCFFEEVGAKREWGGGNKRKREREREKFFSDARSDGDVVALVLVLLVSSFLSMLETLLLRLDGGVLRSVFFVVVVAARPVDLVIEAAGDGLCDVVVVVVAVEHRRRRRRRCPPHRSSSPPPGAEREGRGRGRVGQPRKARRQRRLRPAVGEGGGKSGRRRR